MNWGPHHQYILDNDVDVDVVENREALVLSNLFLLIRTSHSIYTRLCLYLISFSLVNSYTARTIVWNTTLIAHIRHFDFIVFSLRWQVMFFVNACFNEIYIDDQISLWNNFVVSNCICLELIYVYIFCFQRLISVVTI